MWLLKREECGGNDYNKVSARGTYLITRKLIQMPLGK